MANRTWSNFGHFYAPHSMPVLIDCNFNVGSSGAVSGLVGTTVKSVTRLAVGQYQVKLQDNYFKLMGFEGMVRSPVTGSAVLVTAITPGLVYQITTVGTTTTAQWVTAGVPVGITPAVGVVFLAAATSAGTGAGKLLGAAGNNLELIGLPNLMLAPSGIANIGALINFQVIGPTDATHTAPIAVDPPSGSSIFLQMYLSNSSVVVQGE